jgi:hypothetical protein
MSVSHSPNSFLYIPLDWESHALWDWHRLLKDKIPSHVVCVPHPHNCRSLWSVHRVIHHGINDKYLSHGQCTHELPGRLTSHCFPCHCWLPAQRWSSSVQTGEIRAPVCLLSPQTTSCYRHWKIPPHDNSPGHSTTNMLASTEFNYMTSNSLQHSFLFHTQKTWTDNMCLILSVYLFPYSTTHISINYLTQWSSP